MAVSCKCKEASRRLSNELMAESQRLFFELLFVCTGAKNSLSRPYTEEQWNDALELAQEQAVDGVLLSAIERLPEEQRPPKMVLLQWIGSVQMVEQNTAALTKAGREVVAFFRNKGLACSLLKGAAVGRYYPEPLRRTSGDVDIWVDGGRKKIYDFARKFDKDGKLYGVNYQHIHLHLMEDVHVEVHIWPSYLSSPLRNRRLHQFCNLHRPTMDSDMPSLAFDRVFILLHAYQHFCGHGVGLRQIMDYYYVLKGSFEDNHNDNLLETAVAEQATKGRANDNKGALRSKSFKNFNQNHSKEDAVYWIRQLGMNRFASGLMWVLREFFGLEEQYLLLEPNEKEGRFIIQEVMQTGNMGHSDTRNWGSLKSPQSRFFFNLRRDIYLAKHCPHEVLWQPFFSLWLYVWRWWCLKQ